MRQGPARIRSDLRQRGVAQETVERALYAALEETPEREAAAAAARRLLQKKTGRLGPREYRRVSGRLLRDGFSPEVVRETLRRTGHDDIDWDQD